MRSRKIKQVERIYKYIYIYFLKEDWMNKKKRNGKKM